MPKTKFYHDFRNVKDGDAAPVKILITHNGTRSYVTTDVRLFKPEWNGTQVVSRFDAARLNAYLQNIKAQVDTVIFTLEMSGRKDQFTANDIRDAYLAQQGDESVARRKVSKNLIESRFQEYANSRKAPKTRQMYLYTLEKLRLYDPKLSAKRFDDIDAKWVRGFESSLLQTMKTNSANIHLRNLRAVFNEALEDEITTNYPFRKVKIKAQATKDRSLTADELRTIFNYPCQPWQQEYVDIFKLMFCLIGINIGDLSNLKTIHSGRIEYDRLKTGKHYSIKVEPEALELIEKHSGKSHLLDILDKYTSYQDYLQHLNKALKGLGRNYRFGAKTTGEALFPDLSTYYARYSWASIAAELDIPKETIAAALGHTTMDVTAIYIRTDMKKKIDAANRKVLDYVLYSELPTN